MLLSQAKTNIVMASKMLNDGISLLFLKSKMIKLCILILVTKLHLGPLVVCGKLCFVLETPTL